MYISSKAENLLRNILLNFEVAYRSYVADKITRELNIHSKTDFEQKIDAIILDLKPGIINLDRLRNQALSIKGNIQKEYDNLESAYKNFKNQIPPTKGKSFYLSRVVWLTDLLFEELFAELSSSFTSIVEFQYYFNKYLDLRNSLSHTGTSRISIKDSEMSIALIKGLSKNLTDNYYWNYSKDEIDIDILEFERNLGDGSLRFHNLSDLRNASQKVLCRQDVINEIKERLFGKEEFDRVDYAIMLYGDGGVGKSAIVEETLKQIIKESQDGVIRKKMDFIIYLSHKSEYLGYDNNGDLVLNHIQQQFESFDDLAKKLCVFFSLQTVMDIKYYNEFSGIIVIDNFETMQADDKTKVLELIRKSPQDIQYVLTARTDEIQLPKYHIGGFIDEELGREFVASYIHEYKLNVDLKSEEVSSLLLETNGNTLLLILSLQRLNDGVSTFEMILGELRNVVNQNSEVIVDFMYKNTIEYAIDNLKSEGYDPVIVLQMLLLYGEPVDVYPLSVLTKTPLSVIEKVCRVLASKLILEKNGEMYVLNEFASKFIITKFLPDQVGLTKYQNQIANIKSEQQRVLSKLNSNKGKSEELSRIMQDWQAAHNTDRICIAQAFDKYGEAIKMDRTKKEEFFKRLDNFNEEFDQYELRTKHPYILFQKARCYSEIVRRNRKHLSKVEWDELMCKANDNFEKTIHTIKYHYTGIKTSRSYAAVLWVSAISMFAHKKYENIGTVLRRLEDAAVVVTAIDTNATLYKKIYDYTYDRYISTYKHTGDKAYKERAKFFKL